VYLHKSARITRDGLRRLSLWRHWDYDKPHVQWIMLNPSTADDQKDDATIRRCVAFARSWGYGGIVIRNLFSWRATDPRVLKTLGREKAVGKPFEWEMEGTVACKKISVAAWGNHGTLFGRGEEVRKFFRDQEIPLFYLKLSKTGQPCHPLYLKSDLRPTLWT
jgi:hypothetical protein